MLSFSCKRFDGKVPEPGDPSSSFPRLRSGQAGQGFDDEGRALLEKVESGFETVGELYNACKFRAVPSVAPSQGSGLRLRTSLGEALALAREANVYTFAALSAGLDRKAPWVQIKEDPQSAATTVYVILRVVDNLKTILAPILPNMPVRQRRHVLRTGHRSCTSTWATRGSPSTPLRTGSLGRSTSSSTRRRPAATRR